MAAGGAKEGEAGEAGVEDGASDFSSVDVGAAFFWEAAAFLGLGAAAFFFPCGLVTWWNK